MVWMWKPSSVAKAVQNACYAEENMNLKGGMRSTIQQPIGFMGKSPRTFFEGGSYRPPPYGNRVTPRTLVACILVVASTKSYSSPMA
jgi:hypothetical protein